jgi:enoyl-CoA hydratase
MAELVLVDTVDRVCTVTLNRPEARNALSVALQRAAGAALAAADQDHRADVVILTGTDPAFCAGLDLRELGKDAANLVGGADDAAISPFAALWKMTKPVIGAINGPCVTGGFELALACDFLVASERAAFADTHARVGVMPAGGMSVFLPKVVGVRKAKEMSLSGNFMGAHEAFARGLVNHVVAHENLLPAARQLAADIVGNDQAAVRNLKKLYDANEKVTVGTAIDQEQEYFRAWRVDPSEIERRREGIVERGRDQQ